jgi:hypothetical protein
MIRYFRRYFSIYIINPGLQFNIISSRLLSYNTHKINIIRKIIEAIINSP